MNTSTKCIRYILLCLFCSNPLFFFAQVDFQEVKMEKIDVPSKLPQLLFFTSVWCPSCQQMDATTFQDAHVSNIINNDYAAYKIDTDEKEMKAWIEKYSVTCIPTTIIIDKNNNLVHRIESPISTNYLTELIGVQLESPIIAKTENQSDSNQDQKTLNKDNKLVVLKEKHSNQLDNPQLKPKAELPISTNQEKLSEKGVAVNKEKTKAPLKKELDASSMKIKNSPDLIASNSTVIPDPKNTNNTISEKEKEAAKKITNSAIKEDKSKKIATKKTKATTPIASKSFQKRLAYNRKVISHLQLEKPNKKGDNFIVQLGKFQNIRNVERFVQNIKHRFEYTVKVLYEKEGDVPMQIVYIGEFKTQKEAIAANIELKEINRKGIIKAF